MICNLCPRKCGAYKDENTAGGFCGVSATAHVARIAPHMWEEPCISGSHGSGAVFFSGCTMRCAFCQNYEISAGRLGSAVSPVKLSEEYRRLESLGVHNINLVSATQYMPAVIESLRLYKPSVPVVYNCGGYERVETLRALEPYVDIYLPDFKYSDNELGRLFSDTEDYPNTATAAIGEMLRQKGNLYVGEDGIAKSGVLIRHLVLPSHTKNSIGVLEMIRQSFGSDVCVSLMCQYVPCARAKEFDGLNRKITQREYDKVLGRLLSLGLDGYAQELKAADSGFIPKWDYRNQQL